MTAREATFRTRTGLVSPLITVQDFVDVLSGAFADFSDLFEIAVDPNGVLARLRAEIEARRPVAIGVVGPDLIDGDLHLSIRTAGGGSFTIVVRPEGGHKVVETP